jgi:hypothetical protein
MTLVRYGDGPAQSEIHSGMITGIRASPAGARRTRGASRSGARALHVA